MGSGSTCGGMQEPEVAGNAEWLSRPEARTAATTVKPAQKKHQWQAGAGKRRILFGSSNNCDCCDTASELVSVLSLLNLAHLQICCI